MRPKILETGLVIASTEFIWVYNELFRFIHDEGGEEGLIEFWEGIRENFLGNLRECVREAGFEGMREYWSHTLGEEGGRHHMTHYDDMFVLDMHECPSAKLVHQSGRVKPFSKYCEHCRWLYPPLIREFGYEVDFDVISCEEGRCRMTVRKPQSK